MKTWRLAAFLLGAAPASLLAQPHAPKIEAKTPVECTTAISRWRNEQLAPAMAPLRTKTGAERDEAMRAYAAAYAIVGPEAIRAANECASRFDAAAIAPSQLPDLISLYTFAGDTSGRRRATDRLLSSTDLPPRQRAQAMLIGVNQEISKASGLFDIIPGAEKLVATIDALPDSLSDIKLAAHSTMLGRYDYLDVNQGLLNHATALIALGRRLKNDRAMLSGFSSLARSAADRLQPDSALAILAAAEQELGAEKTAREFDDFRKRYAMIGSKAPPLTGQWWLNHAGTAPLDPGDGKVRLIEFTATWCMPCKNSYPGLRLVAERFRGKNFEGVMVTSLYGYLGDKRNLTPAEEVEADREYYTKEHALPFKVAINPQGREATGPDAAYRVGGIPQIIIVDRRGVIRQIVTGWDQGNTQRIGDLIDRLLKEPTT